MKIARTFIAPLVCVFAAQSMAQSPRVVTMAGNGPTLIASGSSIEYLDRAKMGVAELDFSQLMYKQDQDDYRKADAEAYAAYSALYGTCTGSDFNSCTGFRRLEQISNDTFSSRKINFVDVADLNNAISQFTESYRLFETKIAALQALAPVWKNLADSSTQANQPAQALIYKRGSVNLSALAYIYEAQLGKLDSLATGLQYHISAGGPAYDTGKNEGLTKVGAVEKPAQIQADIQQYLNNLAFDPKTELPDIDALNIALGNEMRPFLNAESLHFVWFNDPQLKDKDQWTQTIAQKAQVLTWIRAAMCRPIGSVALQIPTTEKFGFSYIQRGLANRVRIVPLTNVFNLAATQTMLQNFDTFYVSAQSQHGDLDNVGGIMGFFNRVNSTLTWHNEVDAYLSMMKILRDQMEDEVAIAGDMDKGCLTLRARYQQRYGEDIKGPTARRLASNFVTRGAGSPDDTAASFAKGLTIVASKIKYMAKIDDLKKQNPNVDIFADVFDDTDKVNP